MPDLPHNGTRKRIVRLLWLCLILIVFGIGFGPVYVSSKTAEANLQITCQLSTNQKTQLEALRLALEGERLIAQDLGLPVAVEINHFLEDFKIPEVPAECDEV